VLPVLGTRQIDDIKRSDVVRLLDKIEDENGPHPAQAALAFLSRIFNWHASRDDDFSNPIRRGMARTRASDGARDRVLSDDELSAVWNAAGRSTKPFGRLVQFLLLTATRRNEAARMARGELSGSAWIIPAGRMKNKQEFVIPLSSSARMLIDAMMPVSPFVFSYDGRQPITGFADFKRELDGVCGVTGWRLHDLRRTARSLLSRAGVAPDIAERCLAHTIGGVRGVYDRHAYYDEKKWAFEALANLIERIVHPADNVVAMPDRQAAAG
jgi:integrase